VVAEVLGLVQLELVELVAEVQVIFILELQVTEQQKVQVEAAKVPLQPEVVEMMVLL